MKDLIISVATVNTVVLLIVFAIWLSNITIRKEILPIDKDVVMFFMVGLSIIEVIKGVLKMVNDVL